MVELLSLHIPKAAGTTFRHVLTSVYGADQVFEDYGGTSVSTPIPDTMSVIHGHFQADKYNQKFPTVPRIVWLRHPIFRLISEYFFAQILQDRANAAHAQLLDKNLSLLDFAALPAMKNNLLTWLNTVNLEQFAFVGIQEFYREDLQDLQQHLGWPDLFVESKNTNRYPAYAKRVQEILADTQLVNELALLNEADLQLYHQALDLRAQRRHESVFIQPLLADWNRSQSLWQHGQELRQEPHQESPLAPARQSGPPLPAQDPAAGGPKEPTALSISMAEDHYPIPPESLRWRVINNTDPHAYLASGQRIAQSFAQRIRLHGGDVTAYTRILDFGCGSGRILRGLLPLTQATLVGCDIDQEAIAWDTAHLSFGEFYTTHEYPPLPFEGQTFDFVYAVSVLTHLDEEHQFRWLAEWKRILKPEGLLLVTFKGSQDAKKMKEPAKTQALAQLESHGLYYNETNFWHGVFPQYYQQAFHTPEYVEQHWAKYFSILGIEPPRVINQYSVWMRNTAPYILSPEAQAAAQPASEGNLPGSNRTTWWNKISATNWWVRRLK